MLQANQKINQESLSAKTKLSDNPFPSPLLFLWLMFMQPISLHYLLNDRGIENPDASLIKLWQADSKSSQYKHLYALYLFGIALLITPLASMLTWIIFDQFISQNIDLLEWCGGILVGVSLGMFIAIFYGVANGISIGLTFGMISSIVIGMPDNIQLFSLPYLGDFGIVAITGLVFGMSLGLTDNMTYGLSYGRGKTHKQIIKRNIILSLGAGILLGFLHNSQGIFQVDVWQSSKEGIKCALVISISLFIFEFRLPLYIFEVCIQPILYLFEFGGRLSTLRFSPVLFHNLSYFPHPNLCRHIVLTAQHDIKLSKRVIHACSLSQGQAISGKLALAKLQANELKTLLQQRQFQQIAELKGQWLPCLDGASALLLSVRDTARYLHSTQHSHFAYHRLQYLKQAQCTLKGLENQLLICSSPESQMLKLDVPIWKNIIEKLKREAEAQIALEVPNPFRAGDPLTPERGKEIFKGRRDLALQIEGLLADPRQSVSIALLGPRRCGKTSLLSMLPALLPDTLCVFFDLQDNPIDTPAAFFQSLTRRTQEQARRERCMEIPDLPTGPPMQAASEWLRTLDDLAKNKHILICIDEFERLENVFPGQRRELLQLMGLLRATIQYRQHIRLLVCGVAPFDELDIIWTDHFINVRELKIGFFSQETALSLLMRPVEGFPKNALPYQIAAHIVRRTGGQPYLLQLYASYIVQLLNESGRRTAHLSDVLTAENRVLEEGTYYFRNLIQGSPNDIQNVLEALAEDKPVAINKCQRRWLQRRFLITDNNQISMPIFKLWIQSYWLD